MLIVMMLVSTELEKLTHQKNVLPHVLKNIWTPNGLIMEKITEQKNVSVKNRERVQNIKSTQISMFIQYISK